MKDSLTVGFRDHYTTTFCFIYICILYAIRATLTYTNFVRPTKVLFKKCGPSFLATQSVIILIKSTGCTKRCMHDFFTSNVSDKKILISKINLKINFKVTNSLICNTHWHNMYTVNMKNVIGFNSWLSKVSFHLVLQ